MDNTFSKELIELAQKDLSARDRLMSEGQLSGGYHPEMEMIHRKNAERLREIIKEIGFPTVSKVGAQAGNAAWLIIQHSIGEPEFMKNCYKMMMENSNDIHPSNIAYLYDRIQVFESKPQRYGTQLTSEGIPYPVENKMHLNKERLKVDLPTFSPEEINRISGAEDIPEIDRKDIDYNRWRLKVGWISAFPSGM
ncbi:hypothetical protein B0A69_21895 [Chryseobacterium shigense]|uniref:Uncharacterized protein n=1 Tax=Chryseobacterium shigense TaxID=297244 RepID=A0A1N7KG99_9FLAO|nr:DUF6624 domain-containing protein [Chryseobacterium shigense]PQA89876.1 hypothetical protein B0A69_21895 [Chryseobacterium shigense]SIS60500.1 hypothetical protein SAMN05421639_11027 [Chryseobacterium shigense]